eukprot:3371017-Alexandrium_andersonii.AAC.1
MHRARLGGLFRPKLPNAVSGGVRRYSALSGAFQAALSGAFGRRSTPAGAFRRVKFRGSSEGVRR